MAQLWHYIGKNASLENAALYTQVGVIVETLLLNKLGLMSRPSAGSYSWVLSAPIIDKNGAAVGLFDLGTLRNSFLATGLIKFGAVISGSYWFSGMKYAKPVKILLAEDERGTAAIRADSYPEGKIVSLTCQGEDDALLSSDIIDVAAKKFKIMKSYVASPNGKALTEVASIPGGGYGLLNRKKKIVVYGASFSKATPLELDFYTFEKVGESSPQPSAVFTYKGSDERYYASVFSKDGSIVMHGVWLNDDARMAGKATAPTDFRTIVVAK